MFKPQCELSASKLSNKQPLIDLLVYTGLFFKEIPEDLGYRDQALHPISLSIRRLYKISSHRKLECS
jgi:hypothetical protein